MITYVSLPQEQNYSWSIRKSIQQSYFRECISSIQNPLYYKAFSLNKPFKNTITGTGFIILKYKKCFRNLISWQISWEKPMITNLCVLNEIFVLNIRFPSRIMWNSRICNRVILNREKAENMPLKIQFWFHNNSL